MTQPVQEPSQGRTDQGQEFRTRQLFRRPAPVGGTQPAFAVGYRLAADAVQSIPNNARTNLQFAHFVTSDQDVFATAATAVGAESNTAGDEIMLLKAEGTYSAFMVCDFASGFGANFARDVLISSAGGTSNYLLHSDTPANAFSQVFSVNNTSLFMIDVENFVVTTAGLGNGIKGDAFQASGVSKDVDSYYLFVTYDPTAAPVTVY